MKVGMKLILCLAGGLVLLSGGAWMWRAKTNATQQQTVAGTQLSKNERIVLEKYRDKLDRVKADGTNKIVIFTTAIPSPIRSLQEIINEDSLLRVRVIDKEIVVNEESLSLSTWYKLAVIEVLQQQAKIEDNFLPQEIPDRLLPVRNSEAIVVLTGGAITVDGVRIVHTFGNGFFALSKNQEYLLFAHLESGGKFIRPIADSAGAYRIEKNTLVPLEKRPDHTLVQEMREKYNNDLDSFRADMRLRLLRKN